MIKQNLIIILLIMVSMYNINSEIESLNENIIRIMGTIEDNINDIKPILKENWHGVRMGRWHNQLSIFSEKPLSSSDIHAPFMGCQYSPKYKFTMI